VIKSESLKKLGILVVRKRGEVAGVLQRTPLGCTFQYDKRYLEDGAIGKERYPVAFTLPLQATPFAVGGDNLHPFFAGLLPEGRRLSALVKSIKTSEDDLFSLLAASGDDLIGDVTVKPIDTESAVLSVDQIKLDTVVFEELFEKSISSILYDTRLQDPGIAGVQPKISGQMISFPINITNSKNRYILKLSPPDYPGLVENEYLFMTMARQVGLKVARVQLVKDKNLCSGLLVERFDRTYDLKEKVIVPWQQEDACQFLNRFPADKYRISLAEIVQGIEQYATSPLVETLRLLEVVAFSYLITNGDHHAKNISLNIDPSSKRIALSPAYDLIATLPYGDTSMALEFEGRNKNIKARDFLKFSARWKIPEKAVSQMLRKISLSVHRTVADIGIPGIKTEKIKQLKGEMNRRLDHLKL